MYKSWFYVIFIDSVAMLPYFKKTSLKVIKIHIFCWQESAIFFYYTVEHGYGKFLGTRIISSFYLYFAVFKTMK